MVSTAGLVALLHPQGTTTVRSQPARASAQMMINFFKMFRLSLEDVEDLCIEVNNFV